MAATENATWFSYAPDLANALRRDDPAFAMMADRRLRKTMTGALEGGRFFVTWSIKYPKRREYRAGYATENPKTGAITAMTFVDPFTTERGARELARAAAELVVDYSAAGEV